MHQLRMLHLDIKPQNDLVDNHGDLFLADLGLAHQLQDLTHFLPSQTDGCIGTANYM